MQLSSMYDHIVPYMTEQFSMGYLYHAHKARKHSRAATAQTPAKAAAHHIPCHDCNAAFIWGHPSHHNPFALQSTLAHKQPDQLSKVRHDWENWGRGVGEAKPVQLVAGEQINALQETNLCGMVRVAYEQ